MSSTKDDIHTIAGQHSSELLNYLLHRRSVPAKKLKEPGPSDAEIRQIIRAASRVSDHGKMFPWWFEIFKGESKQRFSEFLLGLMKEHDPEKKTEKLEKKALKYMRAPVVIAVISSPRFSKIPLWEQYMSAGAACQNLVLSANALGYGVNWLTEWYSYELKVKRAMGLEKGENIAGFFSIGTVHEVPSDRARPDIKDFMTYWEGERTVFCKGQDYARLKNIRSDYDAGFEFPPSQTEGNKNKGLDD